MKTSNLHLAPLMVVGVLILGMTTMGRAQPRLQADFRQGIDSLRLKGMPHQMLDEMVKRNGHQGSPSPLRKVSFPQSQIYVIDTAMVGGSSGGTRHLYSFNASAKRTCDLTQKLTAELWVDSLRETNTYDASKNMLTDVYESWSDGQWVGQYSYTYTYDASGNRLAELDEVWSVGQWVGDLRDTYTYDANGNMLTVLYERASDGQWVNSMRYTYTYDTNGNRLSVLYERLSDGQWVNSMHYTYTYDANGNMLTESFAGWREDLGGWVYQEGYFYTYDANGNMLTKRYELFVWDYFTGGQWSPQCRFTYTYDANGNMLTSLYEHCMDDQWLNSGRHTYTYDANGKMLTDLDESWLNGQWVHWWTSTWTYDAHGNVTSVSFPGGGVKYPQTWSTTDSAGNEYHYTQCTYVTLTRKLILTGVSTETTNVPEVYTLSQNYPNPFNPSTTIKYELPKSSMVRLSVYDMLGREVSVLVNERRDAGVHEVKFDGSGLSSGMYVYRLTAGDFVQSRKLMILR